MVRDLPALFFDFKLLCLVLLATKALTEKLLVPHVLIDLNEDLVRLSDITKSKCSHTSLCQCSVVYDLVVNMLHSNNLVHMSLHQETSCLI